MTKNIDWGVLKKLNFYNALALIFVYYYLSSLLPKDSLGYFLLISGMVVSILFLLSHIFHPLLKRWGYVNR